MFALHMLYIQNYHTIFKQVFGANFNQVRLVFGGQSGNGGQYAGAYNFMTARYGPMKTWATDLALAPYLTVTTFSSLAALFDDMNGQMTGGLNSSVGQRLAYNETWANKWGLNLIAYEGGSDTHDGGRVMCQAMDDARMYTAYLTYFSLWDAAIGRSHLFTHFNWVQPCGDNSYGLMESSSQVCRQKYAAALYLSTNGGQSCTPQ
jgi:hypothetical protein